MAPFEIEKRKKDEPSKVIINYTAFFASLTTIAGALVAILIFLFSIKTDLEVVKEHHERRIISLEIEQTKSQGKQWEHDLRIQRNEDRIKSYHEN